VESPLASLTFTADRPRHRQLHDALREAIREGRLTRGARVPSSRRLADDLGLARNTVARVYDDLISEGYLVGRQGSGTYVADSSPDPPRSTFEPAPPARPSQWSLRAGGVAPMAVPGDGPLPYDFRPGTPDWDAFPRRIWWRLVGRRLRDGSALRRYGDPAGYQPLREAISRHLSATRGVICRGDQVVIVNGTQQAIDILARVLVDPGDRVVVEDPGYVEARQLFNAYGAILWPAAVDGLGLRTDTLPVGATRLAYVTPAHQYPTGAALALERRAELLSWAETHNAYIVEDDYDAEFRHGAGARESLQGLEGGRRVLYLGTFSTVLFPPLRVGFVVLPSSLVLPFTRAKWLADRGTGLLEQQALADFLDEGHFIRHVRRSRRRALARRITLEIALARALGGEAEIFPDAGGSHILVRFPGRDAVAIARAARARGVGVYPAAPSYVAREAPQDLVLLGFGALAESTIDTGITHLATAVRTIPRGLPTPRLSA